MSTPAWKVARQEAHEAQERRKKDEADAKARKLSELRASASNIDRPLLDSPTNGVDAASPPSSSPLSSLATSPVSSSNVSVNGSSSTSSTTSNNSSNSNSKKSESVDGKPKWRVLQEERQKFQADLKRREREAKLKKLADLGLLVKPSVGAEPPEGIPNPNAVVKETGEALRHSHLDHIQGSDVLKVTVDVLSDSEDEQHQQNDKNDSSAEAVAAAAAEQAAATAQMQAFLAQQAAFARAQQAAYRAAFPFPPDIAQDIDDVRAHVMRLLQPVGVLNGVQLDGFDLEYEYLSEKQLSAPPPLFVAALTEANIAKNRYTNILPPEHTRVKLSVRDGDPNSDYINANLISARRDMPRRYISCQGPLESTATDMWRMVWEAGSSVVVMLTREIEKGFVKCDRYWPDPTTPGMCDEQGVCRAQYGDLLVTFIDEQAGDEFVVRRFDVSDVKQSEASARRVTQLMYFGWPDHGIPASRGGFLQMCALGDAANASTPDAPLVVHCSAGVGRTGTFCAVHGALERFMSDLNRGVKPLVNILESVREMREMRPGMVQTKEQYVFAYLAVLEQTELWLFERGLLPDEPAADGSSDAATSATTHVDATADGVGHGAGDAGDATADVEVYDDVEPNALSPRAVDGAPTSDDAAAAVVAAATVATSETHEAATTPSNAT